MTRGVNNWVLGDGFVFAYHIVAEQEEHSFPQFVCCATQVTPEDHTYQLRLW